MTARDDSRTPAWNSKRRAQLSDIERAGFAKALEGSGILAPGEKVVRDQVVMLVPLHSVHRHFDSLGPRAREDPR